MSRPFPIRVAQGALVLFMVSGIIQAARFLSFSSVWAMYWALPAGLAVIAGSVLVGIHQGRAIARPLAMAGFGAIAVRGAVRVLDD